MGWASQITRAGTRPAGSGLAAMSTGAGPLISAFMANFITVHAYSLATGPPPIACNGRGILVGMLTEPQSHIVALYITSRLHARGGRAYACFTAPARDSSQTGAGRRPTRTMLHEELKEEDLRGQASSMEKEVQEYMNVIVGVVGFLLAPGYATTSTISSMRRGSCGSAVAELFWAAGFASTPFLRLATWTSLATTPTARVYVDVPGVARSMLPTRF